MYWHVDALDDKSRLRLIRAADFSYVCAEAAKIVAEIHGDDSKVVAIKIIYPRLRDPDGFNELCEQTLQWPEDRQAAKQVLVESPANSTPSGKSAGGVSAATAPSTEFERNVPSGYNAPSMLETLQAAPTQHKFESEQNANLQPMPELESNQASETEKQIAPSTTAEPSTTGTTFSLAILQAGCPAGVDASAKELALDEVEFEAALGHTKEAFLKLPKWKRDAAKRKAKIF